jgi:dTDP-4-amino-4,6-dideoxygalactose transaminase
MTEQTSFKNYGAAGPDKTWHYVKKQLDRLPGQITKVRKHNEVLFEVLASVGITVPASWLLETSVFLRIPIFIQHRDSFEAAMQSEGIDTARWFEGPVSSKNTDKASTYYPGLCPVGENIARSVSNVPTHASMSDSDVKTTAAALVNYFESNRDEVEYMTQILADDASLKIDSDTGIETTSPSTD